MENFKEKLLEVLEVETINDNDVLKDFDSWDSLTLLTLIATVESEFGFTMSALDLNEIDTIKDLVAFIENKKKHKLL
jgi:acyl carrier protein